MKKPYYFAAAFLCLAVAYLAGYWSELACGTPRRALPRRHHRRRPSADRRDRSVSEDAFPPGTVKVSPDKQQLMGIRLATAEKVSETHTLRVLGRVATDETRVYRINAAVDGWIRETYSNSTGSLVKKDEPLASFYSPEFLSAQQAYILRPRTRWTASRPAAKKRPDRSSQTGHNIQQYKDTLQKPRDGRNSRSRRSAEPAITRKTSRSRPPATGFILARNVSPGESIEKGKELYRIADLGRVWILADVFENEGLHYSSPARPSR